MYEKLVEGTVECLVRLLKRRAVPVGDGDRRHVGSLELAAMLLARPGVNWQDMYAKLAHVFGDVHKNWVHTKLAEEQLVRAVLA